LDQQQRISGSDQISRSHRIRSTPSSDLPDQSTLGLLLRGAFFETVFSPKGLQQILQKCCKSKDFRLRWFLQWFQLFHMHNRCAKHAQMHLNMSPTCFEGPGAGKWGLRIRGRKIWFRAPARNLALMPKSTSFKDDDDERMKFAGLMSRCTMEWPWQ